MIWEAIQRAKLEKQPQRHLVGPGKCSRIDTTPNDPASPEDVPCSGGYTSDAR